MMKQSKSAFKIKYLSVFHDALCFGVKKVVTPKSLQEYFSLETQLGCIYVRKIC